jgi:sugar lactone lactonase YvrE
MLVRDPASHSMGWSIDWLPDGRLLTTGAKLEWQEPDGSMVTLAEQHANEIVVDPSGKIYINGADFDFVGGGAPKPGYIKLVTPDGQLRQVAGDIRFPNGMVITADNHADHRRVARGPTHRLRHRPRRRAVRPARVRRRPGPGRHHHGR